MQSSGTISSIIFLALSVITSSLLPATQFIGISYADHDNGKGKGNAYGHNDHDEDDDNDNDNPDGLVIEASKDTYLRKIAADTNEGANEILRLTHIGSNRVLVAFDLSEIEDEVESATLQLYIVRNENDWKEVGRIAKTIKHQTISVHALSQYWEEGNGSNEIFDRHRGNGHGATWHCADDTEIKNNKPDCRHKWHGGKFEKSSTDEVSIRNGMTARWVEFDVTQDVNEFLAGEATNYGWLVKKDQENLHGAIRFASSETDKGPRLVISGLGDPNGVPNAADDSATTDEDAPVTFNVLSNDSDPDGNALTAAIATGPSHGKIAIAASGSATYTPDANYYGSDSFTYSASDGQDTDTATVMITVNPVNDPPVASSPSVTVGEDDTITITLLAIDIDSNNLVYIIVSSPLHGALGDDDGDNAITYTPTPGFVGGDSFTFKANDGSADSNVATVSITVTDLPNQDPVAVDDSATTDEGDTVIIDVLGNDSDGDGGSLNVVSVSHPAHGTAVINGDNTITYTPNATYSGTDSFTYYIEDGQGGNDHATVNVTINLVNGAPIANDDSGTTDEDSPVTINVLSNDSDPDGDMISIDAITNPTYGNATIASGSIVYTPDSGAQSLQVGQTATDTFSYTIIDGIEDDTATVTITINGLNDMPVASDAQIITDEDELIEYTLPASDPDNGDSLTFEIETEPTSGSVSLDPDGGIIYSPDTNYDGPDSFVYSATDSSGSSDTGTILVTVNPVNDPPVAVDDEDPTTSPGVEVTVDVLANDFDPEGDPIEVTSISTPSHGTAEINSDGTITYTPDLDLIGQDSFTYTISDDNGGTATAIVVVTVNLGVIDAINDSATTQRNQEVEIEILDNDLGFVEDPLIPNGDRIAITGQPSHGTVTINADGTATYDPAPSFTGIDSFVYTIYTPDFSDFDSATVTVTVVNPP
jgi:VCBS repeat-containing protein